MEQRIGENARPIKQMFRWPRGESAQQPMIVKQGEKLLVGATQFFPALRAFWTNLMCNDPGNQRRELTCFIASARSDLCPLGKETLSFGNLFHEWALDRVAKQST